ncbi:TIGR03085 family metal-binding protein [Fodinicola acaciae]|uniref:TIGR03085 family metal-binding protein n=1 Tax=Fodinicola acaciae TaxID=2681555 RepID=UPI0013CFA991|nr:TIGR03085 family metal-binding protein [Fodinicola acaciae]
MTSHARSERTALVAAMREVGPDAPTLCAGWTTRDLAAHLVARERRPDGSLGILIKPLASYTEKVRTGLMEAKSYDELLDLIDRGAVWSPTGNPLADGVVNLAEFFIHHEDVRRAQPGWGPRGIPAEVEQKFWNNLRILAPLTLRNAPVGIMMTANGGRTIRPNRGEPVVRLDGQPSELLLFVSGRQSAARLHIDGEQSAVDSLMSASFAL